MSNPTSNFGWQMPTATDLVTDLPADFEVFGQAVDTDFVDLLGGTTGQILSKTSATDLDFTWIANDQGDITGVTAGNGITVTSPTGPVPTVAIDTAITVDKTTAQTLTNKTLTTPIISSISNTGTLTLPTSTDTLVGRATTDTLTNKTLTSPALTTPTISTLTTNGDLLYGTGSGALARKAIGSAGQVLTVASGIPSWATPASTGAMTLIKRATTTGAVSTGTTFDGVFTATYKTYQIVIEQWYAGTRDDDGIFKYRKAAVTTSASYYSAANEFTESNTTINLSASNVAQLTLTSEIGDVTYPRSALTITITPNVTQPPLGYFYGMAGGSTGVLAPRGAFFNNGVTAPDGFILSTASNTTCTVAVYGLAIS